MKKTAFAFSVILPLLVACQTSPQPAATSPLPSPEPAPTDTPIPQGPEWLVYDTANSGVPDNRIFALAIDGQGNKWIGTGEPDGPGGSGLVKFDGESWSVYDTDNSGLPNNKVYPIVVDAQGSIWIGTQGGGLAVYRQGGAM